LCPYQRHVPLNRLPEMCGRCAKSHRPFVHSGCKFCKDIGFQEEVLCDLNRSVQDIKKGFECHAFKPVSTPAMSLVSEARPSLDEQMDEAPPASFDALLNSDRLKYRRTLAVQRLQQDPEAIYMELKYHVAWNTVSRKPVFIHSTGTFDMIDNAFFDCGELAGGFVSLLWLAPDHMHLYIESDGEKSIDAIVRHLKRVSANALNKTTGGVDRRIWDKAYFAETVG
jgi:REP element-mobilizing transposase RayT